MAVKNSELELRSPEAVLMQGMFREYQEAVENKEWVNTITSDCILEFVLEDLLKQTFSQQSKKVTDLFDCSMIRKAKFAYAMGLIDKMTLGDLKLIKDIRNKFAHSIAISFADSKVRNKCKGLSTAKGHTVTASNAYKIYKNAVNQCQKNIITTKIRQKKKQKQ